MEREQNKNQISGLQETQKKVEVQYYLIREATVSVVLFGYEFEMKGVGALLYLKLGDTIIRIAECWITTAFSSPSFTIPASEK